MKNHFNNNAIILTIILSIQFLFRPVAVAGSDPLFINIDVKETAGLNITRPVTGGVPLARGFAPEGSRLILLDSDNKPVPCQTEVLNRWDDGSIKWVLLDFQATPQIKGTKHFRLTKAMNIKDPDHSQPVKSRRRETLFLSVPDR